MIYDQHTDINAINLPAVQVVIRSEDNRRASIDPETLIARDYSRKASKRNYTASSSVRFDVSKFTNNLESITRRTSTAKCAKSIRVALQSAGANIQSHPVAAADWGGTLKQLGYKEISPAFDYPQKGDIYIIDRTRSHVYGHIAGYTGSNWISDFRQNGYAVYKDIHVNYRYFRPAS